MKRMSAGLAFFVCIMFFGMSRPLPVSAEENLPGKIPIDQIDAYVDEQMKVGQIPGLSLGIIEQGEVVVLKGYGTSDRHGTPVTPQTLFTVGSVGKTFTALCIRQLANQGKIEFDAPVQEYLPWFTLADSQAATKIRIIDLLKHESGLSNRDGTSPAMYNGAYSIEQLVRSLSSVMPVRPAGTAAEYSNLNYVILGHVIEAVSGLSYDAYLESFVFEPLGMQHSYPSAKAASTAARNDQADLAEGHYVMFGMPVRNHEPLPTGQVPAGFQVSSAEDLTRFASLYLNNGYFAGQSIIPANELPEWKLPFAEGGAMI